MILVGLAPNAKGNRAAAKRLGTRKTRRPPLRLTALLAGRLCVSKPHLISSPLVEFVDPKSNKTSCSGCASSFQEIPLDLGRNGRSFAAPPREMFAVVAYRIICRANFGLSALPNCLRFILRICWSDDERSPTDRILWILVGRKILFPECIARDNLNAGVVGRIVCHFICGVVVDGVVIDRDSHALDWVCEILDDKCNDHFGCPFAALCGNEITIAVTKPNVVGLVPANAFLTGFREPPPASPSLP